MRRHQATWDWFAGELVYQEGGLANDGQACKLLRTEELPPRSIQCYKAQVCNQQATPTAIQVHGGSLGKPGLVLGDLLGNPQDGQMDLLVENRTDDYQTLLAGTVMGSWEVLESEDVVISLVRDEADEYPGEEEDETTGGNRRDDIVYLTEEEQERRTALIESLETILPPVSPEFTLEDRTSAVQLLWEHEDVFALRTADLGRTDLVEHEIDVGDSKPVRMAPRRIPLHKMEVVEKAIEEMESKGVIRPSSSPWAAPIVIVQKKDGTARFCVDYRNLNDCTRKDAYPLPRIEDNLDALEGAKWFSTLDLASGYWQVAVAEKDRPKTAFTTKFGLYEFNVLPFGLCNGPATFQRLMEQVLRGLQWKTLVLYLDDIVVFSETLEKHIARLAEVLDRLKEAGLKLKPKKCQLFKHQVHFLGHLIDRAGIHTDPDKIRQIENWPVPENLTDVRIFLGLTSYYRRFVKDYALLASPLYELTKKDVDFHWGPEQDEALKTLKKQMVQSTLLSYPILGLDGFILDTDASQVAIGAVLSQVQGGEEKVLAFGSRCLSKPELQYCVTRKEFLAIVYFMCYYKHYLIGTPVTVRTDHGSLTWLKNMRNPTGQLARWKERLAPFTWTIVHRPGKLHLNADALSRKRCLGDCPQCLKMCPNLAPDVERAVRLLEELGETVLTLNSVHCDQWPGDPRTVARLSKRKVRQDEEAIIIEDVRGIWDRDAFVLATTRDPVLREVLTWTSKPDWELIATRSKECKFFWNHWDQGKVRIIDRLIWYRFDLNAQTFQWKLVIPGVYQERVLEALHDSPTAGHLGEKRSVALLRRTPVFWIGCLQDMRLHCRSCEVCLRCKPQQRKGKAPMHSFTAGEPMERIAVDVLGEIHKSRSGNRCVLVVMCYFTKYVFLIPTPDHQADTVAEAMVKEVFTKVGVPRFIHSDRGAEFCSKIFREMCRAFKIDKTFTTPFRPQGNGQVERMNRTLGSMLRAYTNEYQTDWDEYLPLCAMAYNGSKHSSTDYTPNFLMFGRDFRVPLELVLPSPDDDRHFSVNYDSMDHFIKRMKYMFREVYAQTRENLQLAMKVQKRYYDQKANRREFKVGDTVWLYNPRRRKGRTPKLDKSWDGPYAVVKVLSDILYVIQANRRSKSRIVHVDKLVPTRRQYDTGWVFKLPTRHQSLREGIDLDGLGKLFEPPAEVAEPPELPTIPEEPDGGRPDHTEGEDVDPEVTRPGMEAPTEEGNPSLTEGSEVDPPEVAEEDDQPILDFAERPDKDPQTCKKQIQEGAGEPKAAGDFPGRTTRSGKGYLIEVMRDGVDSSHTERRVAQCSLTLLWQ